MKSLLPLQLIVSLMVLGMASTSRAQQVPAPPVTGVAATDVATIGSTTTGVAAPANDEAARAENSSSLPLIALNAPPSTLAALSFSNPFPAAGPTTISAPSSSSSASPAEPANPDPAPTTYRYTERDYRLEIALGVAIVRFRSNVYYATGVGTHTAAAYFLKDWLAVEGAVTTAFAPSVFAGENIKYLGYGAGPKISLGRSRFEPWFHVLGGGMHIVPQTALSGKNGFEVTAGGGVDYGLNPRLALRVEADYLGSHIFGQWQNSAQATAAIVVHF